MKLEKIRRSVRIVRTVRTENGFTDRTNRENCQPVFPYSTAEMENGLKCDRVFADFNSFCHKAMS